MAKQSGGSRRSEETRLRKRLWTVSASLAFLWAGLAFTQDGPAQPAHRGSGEPEVFADGFEPGDTSAWDWTEPPVQLEILSPAQGVAINDPRPVIEVAFSTVTGVDVDPDTLTLGLGDQPLDATCWTLEGSATCAPSMSFADGPVTVAAIIADVKGRLSPARLVTLTVDTVAPDAVDPSRLVVGPKDDDSGLRITGAAGSVEAGARVRIRNGRTDEVVVAVADANGAFSVWMDGLERDLLVLEVVDAAGNTSEPTTLPGDFQVPPDPADTAPPLDPTIATRLDDALEFLWTDPDPIQEGVEPGAIDPRRIGWIRGQVLDRDGAPVPGVRIRALGRDELGSTRTRLDGHFDLVVNGGGTVVLDFERADYLPVQREVHVPWRQSVWADEVRLTPLDPSGFVIEADSETFQIVQGSTQIDADGRRTATVLFPPGTTARLVLPNGDETQPQTFTVRATEYTVGPDGPAVMPAALPANVGYTYAVELSLDEARTLGAERVELSNPLPVYVENFLDFPVGEPMPVGYYDRKLGRWIGERNGIVLEVLGTDEEGRALLDIEGFGDPTHENDLADLGIFDAERSVIAQLYEPGTTLWRAAVDHFTPWDFNRPWGPPGGAIPPPEPPDPGAGGGGGGGGDPDTHDEDDDSEHDPCADTVDGSIIECENQTLRQRIPVVGAPVELWYASDRVEGRGADFSLRIPVTGESVPESVASVEVQVIFAGRRLTRSFPPEPNQTWDLELSGEDAFGRQVVGLQSVRIRRGYAYPLEYRPIRRAFRRSWSQYPEGSYSILRRRSGIHMTLWRDTAASWDQVLKVEVGRWDARGQKMGGFSLDHHHAYDPAGRTVFRGDGSRQSARALGPVVIRHASGFSDPRDLAMGPDGTIFVAGGSDRRVWAVDPEGGVRPFAGDGTRCETVLSDDPDWDPADQCGEGNPALDAQLFEPVGVDVSPEGDVYIADRGLGCVRRVRASTGTLDTVAGRCDSGSGGGSQGLDLSVDPLPAEGLLPGDGDPSSETTLGPLTDVALRSDGAILVATDQGVRMVATDGMLSTVVELSPGGGGGGGSGGGGGGDGGGGDGEGLGETGGDGPGDDPPGPGPGPITAHSLDFGPNGRLYLSDPVAHRVHALEVDGRLSTVAGTGVEGEAPDGTPALEAPLSSPQGLFVNTDGRLYVAETGHRRLRRLDSDGGLYTTTGNGEPGAPISGEPALEASYGTLKATTQSTDGDVYVLANTTIWRVGLALDGYTDGEVLVPSAGGAEVWVFNADGRHLQTLHGLTGTVLRTFTYDDQGLLVGITDADSLTTTVERHEKTGDATAIVGPFGQRTALFHDEDGYLERITNPAGESYGFKYTAGLMARLEDPRFEAEDYEPDPAKRYGYDGRGRLILAQDAENGSTSLSRRGSAGQPDYEVSHKTTRFVTTRYRGHRGRRGEQVREREHADGTVITSTRHGNGVTQLDLPDGSRATRAPRPDPRFGLLAGFAGVDRLERPGGRRLDISASRSVSLVDAEDPFSIETLSHNLTVEGRTTTIEYDGLKRRVTAISPESRRREMDLDARGRAVAARAPGLEDLRIDYRDTGEVEHLTVGEGETARITGFGYDELHRLASVTDAEGQSVTYGYDAANRLDAITLPDQNVVAFEHDAMGNVTEVSPPGRPAHVFTYTKRNQLETYVLPDVGQGSATKTRFYDADRRLERIVRPDGLEIELIREPLMNRLQALALPRGDLSFTYRPDGKPATVTTFDGQGLVYGYDGPMVDEVTWTGPVSGRVEKTYDDALRLESLRVEGAPTVVHAYDDDGFLLRAGALTAVRESDTGRLDHVTVGAMTTSWTYTPFGEIESVTTRLGDPVDGEVIFEESFLYDRRGWITDKTATRGQTTVTETYGYDPRGRLETVHEDGVLRSTFGYDANSNRISYDGPFGTLSPEDIRHDGRDRLEQYGDAGYTTTESGELATKTVGDQTIHFDIDVMGNLRRVDLPSGTTIEYLIDGAQRRIGKKVDGALTRAWLYRDGLRPIAEIDAEGAVVSFFVYATRRNVPDYLIKNGAIYRILSDHLGSPRLVVAAQTGAVAQELRYDAFGRVTLDTQPGFQPFGFAGGLYDPHTGLVRFGARDYDPEVGRWTTPDPIGFRGGQSNLYAYAGSNPINFIDPSGLETVLGIHTDVGANAGMGQGHAWISVSDGDTGTVERVGLYPEEASPSGFLTDQDGDSDLMPEDPIKEARVSRYYLLDDAQGTLLDDLLDDSYEWMPTFNCASFASDVVRKVVGEDLDADDWLGIETPRELARSMERLNGEAPSSGAGGGGTR